MIILITVDSQVGQNMEIPGEFGILVIKFSYSIKSMQYDSCRELFNVFSGRNSEPCVIKSNKQAPLPKTILKRQF